MSDAFAGFGRVGGVVKRQDCGVGRGQGSQGCGIRVQKPGSRFEGLRLCLVLDPPASRRTPREIQSHRAAH